MVNQSERLEIRAGRPPYWTEGVDLAFFRGANETGVITWVRNPDPSVAVQPEITRIDSSAAQRLMDDLWDAGVRPTEGAGSAGQLAAVQNHLGDMRRIVFCGPARDCTPPRVG